MFGLIYCVLCLLVIYVWLRYRPSSEGKYSGDDGKYIHDDEKYVHQEEKYKHTKDTFGGSDGSGGAYNDVVVIGGKPKATTTTKTTTTTTEAPITPPPPLPPLLAELPGPAPFIINAGTDVSNQIAEPTDGIKIIRQEQEESANGYHYLWVKF